CRGRRFPPRPPGTPSLVAAASTCARLLKMRSFSCDVSVSLGSVGLAYLQPVLVDETGVGARDDAFARLEAVQHLDVSRVAPTKGDLASNRDAIVVGYHEHPAPAGILMKRPVRNERCSSLVA